VYYSAIQKQIDPLIIEGVSNLSERLNFQLILIPFGVYYGPEVTHGRSLRNRLYRKLKTTDRNRKIKAPSNVIAKALGYPKNREINTPITNRERSEEVSFFIVSGYNE
jgi:hypothetical protein